MLDNKINHPILSLNFKDAFDQLTPDEKLYMYYLYRASWDGAPIVLFQTSYESPPLFIIFQSFFSSFSPFDELKKIIFLKSNGKITDVDYKHFIRYAAKFYSNMGNYDSFGQTKFIPELDPDHFEEILKCSSNFHSDIKYIWDCTKDIIYDDTLPYRTINLNEKNGKNYFYLGDIREENIKKIDSLLQQKGIDPLNTRLLMINPSKFACLVASVEEKIEEWYPNLIGYYGEFSSFLERINQNLAKAKEFCSNENQRLMLESYIESFHTGSIKKHMDAQRYWVKDKKPCVEMNIGWIETYYDPMGVRASYEGWVALTDKEKTKKFNALVENAEAILLHFPWSSEFERSHFISPDFTALDVVCFASSSCPIGINIPNYQEIKENEGFKNISLSNAYPSYTAENLIFCNEKDIELLKALGKQAYTMHVACHELLGHGSGKLLRKNDKGEFNFEIDLLLNPLTNEKIDKYYLHNETFESRFTTIGRSFEECRADLSGLYFCFFTEIHEIFECDESLYRELIYSQWLLYIRKGIIGLSAYNEQLKTWGHAHTQGAWVFVQYLLENQIAGQEILSIQLENEKKNFTINLNKDMLLCYGQAVVTKMLTSLHIWRCTGDIESAKAFYEKYSVVNDYFLKIRKIIVDVQIPRRLVLNHNLTLDDTNVCIEYYPESLEGIIESFVDRYGTRFNKEIYSQWTKYDTNFLKI